MKRHRKVVVATAFAICLVCLPSFGVSTLPTFPTLANQNTAFATSVGTGDLVGLICVDLSTPTGGCSSSFSGAVTGGSVDFTGTTTSTADYGILKAMVSGSLSVTGVDAGQYNAVLEARPSFFDQTTVSSGPSSGFFDFTFDITGTVSFSSTDPSSATNIALFWTAYDSAGNPIGDGSVPLSAGATTASLSIPYTDSTARYVLGLDTLLQCYAEDSAPCSGTLDFSHTAIVTSLTVLDSDSVVVPDATFTSSSGTDYNGVREVPEPATLLLLGSGLLGLSTVVRRRTR